MKLFVSNRSTKVAIAGMIAAFIALSLHLPSPSWAVYSISICAQATYGATVYKGSLRIFGTTMGAILGFLLAITLKETILIYAVLAVYSMIGIYFGNGSRFVYAWFLSVIVMMLISLNYLYQPHNTIDFLVYRIFNIAMGVSCLFLVDRYCFPDYEHTKLRDKIGKFLKDFEMCYLAFNRYVLDDEQLTDNWFQSLESLSNDITMMRQSLRVSKHEHGVRNLDFHQCENIFILCDALLYELMVPNPIMNSFKEDIKKINLLLIEQIKLLRKAFSQADGKMAVDQHAIELLNQLEKKQVKSSGDIDYQEYCIANAYINKLKRIADYLHNIGASLNKSRRQNVVHQLSQRENDIKLYNKALLKRPISSFRLRLAFASTLTSIICLTLQNVLNLTHFISIVVIIHSILIYVVPSYFSGWRRNYAFILLGIAVGIIAILILRMVPHIYFLLPILGLTLYAGDCIIKSNPQNVLGGMLFSAFSILLMMLPLSESTTFHIMGNLIMLLVVGIPAGTFLSYFVTQITRLISLDKIIKNNHDEFIQMAIQLSKLIHQEINIERFVLAKQVARTKKTLWTICKETRTILSDQRRPLFYFKHDIAAYQQLNNAEYQLYLGLRLLQLNHVYASSNYQAFLKSFDTLLITLIEILTKLEQASNKKIIQEVESWQTAMHQAIKAYHDNNDEVNYLGDVLVSTDIIAKNLINIKNASAKLFC